MNTMTKHPETILSKEANLHLLAGRALAVMKTPYLSSALFAMKPVPDARVGTFAVDDQWRMYFSPDFLTSLSVAEVAGAWLHEVGHLLRHHSARFKALNEPVRRHPLFNMAGDAAINHDLRAVEGIRVPDIKFILPESIAGGTPGMTAEQFYDLILKTPEADKVETQKADVVFSPGNLVEGNVKGAPVGARLRSRMPDTDATVTIDGDATLVADVKVLGDRSVTFKVTAELPVGEYTVTITSGDVTVDGTLAVVKPKVTLRPDHITTTGQNQTKVTVVAENFRYVSNTYVKMVFHAAEVDATFGPRPAEQGTEVTSGYTTALDNPTHLRVEFNQTMPAGYYMIEVHSGSQQTAAMLPVHMPFLDLHPGGLTVGHGTPYPVAFSVDDFTVDSTSTVELYEMLLGQQIPAVSSLTLLSDRNGSFEVTDSLDAGSYRVVVTTGNDRISAEFNVSPPSEGDGGGEGEGDGDGDGDGTGSGSGSGSGSDCGSGAGGGTREWDRGGDTSDGSVDEARGDRIRDTVARDIQNHQKARGDVPGGWTRWADEIMNPQVDWRSALKSTVRRAIGTVAGRKEYSYSRPGRRSSALPKIVTPAMRAPRPPRVVAILDTSGSVSDRMLGQALGDIKSLMKAVNQTSNTPNPIRFIACDAAAADFQSVKALSQIDLTGGGGTDMRVGIEAAANLNPQADIIITFTDGETPWPTEPPANNPTAKYIAVLLAGDTSQYYEVPDFMTKIVVDTAYLNNIKR